MNQVNSRSEKSSTFFGGSNFGRLNNYKDALIHPDQYNDLVVRIGGYTDYFTRLSPEMQQEVIQRTEYESV